MTLWSPSPKGAQRYQHNLGTVGAATPGTTVTTGGTTSTKGSVAELISATNFDAYRVMVMVYGNAASSVASDAAIDILIGASGQEKVLIPNILAGYAGVIPRMWDFPLRVDSGARLSAQAAGRQTSTGIQVGIYIVGGGSPKGRVATKVTTYGMGTVPSGTTVAPGASGAEGSWTQITSGTSEQHWGLIPSFQVGNDTTITPTKHCMLDIGIGSATEEEIMQSYWYYFDQTEFMGGAINPIVHEGDFASGSRLVVRASNSGANDGNYNCVIHALS